MPFGVRPCLRHVLISLLVGSNCRCCCCCTVGVIVVVLLLLLLHCQCYCCCLVVVVATLLLLLVVVSFFNTPYRFKDTPGIVVSFSIPQMLGSVKLVVSPI